MPEPTDQPSQDLEGKVEFLRAAIEDNPYPTAEEYARACRERDDARTALAAVVAERNQMMDEVERLGSVQATLVDCGTYTASQLNRIARIIQHADLLRHHVVEAGPGEEPPTLDSVIQGIQQILVEDEPVKNAWIIVWRELIGGMTLRSEQQLREMAERDRDEARAELERVGGMTAAEVLAWRAEQ